MVQGMDPCIIEQSIDQGVHEGAMDQRAIVAIEGVGAAVFNGPGNSQKDRLKNEKNKNF